ncbi:hybrid sensor histidine kinase/response regulator [Desulfospira joergensenii]|uniref:hybrid sensor histidine kinase/response regulator n=1 Tax=Desulfospira joergensenii TaxID=53329 RepID=UPI0003B30CD6|nr:ATP-binding protein [Desulfospira joergensenii]
MRYNPFTLVFAKNWVHLEPEFQRFYFKETLIKIRVALFVAMAFYAVFGILDALIAPEQKVIFWTIRYLFIVPATTGVLLFSFYPAFERYSQPALFGLCLSGGLGIEMMIALAGPPAAYSYYAGIILVFITIHIFLGMRMVWASACSWTLVLCYEIIAVWVVDTPTAMLINNNFFFISANVFCTLGGYSIELNARHRFFSSHLLELEKEKVSRINQDLDRRVKERTRELSLANEQLNREINERIQAEAARIQLEKELNKKQKLEAIGTLAGGIAHDFNNILAAVIGYTELAMAGRDLSSDGVRYMSEVMNAAVRASELTKQILTFSRQAEQEERPVEVKSVVEEALKLMRATLPTTVKILPHLHSEAWIICDPTQLHRIMVNLCTNSVQAMEDKTGTLEVSLTETVLEKDSRENMDRLAPGPYAVLEVRDTGRGIQPEIMEKIFDPFFTTKEAGRGTGMGLSVVHGVVKQYKGGIRVESEPGAGTVFTIFLPVTRERSRRQVETNPILTGGTEHILVLDDEPALAAMQDKLLSSLGYQVVHFTDSLKAVEYAANHGRSLDLVITDFTMPGLTGLEVAEQIQTLIPDIPVILCTGFSEDITAGKMKQAGIASLLMKPVVRGVLAGTVRRVLDQPKEGTLSPEDLSDSTRN